MFIIIIVTNMFPPLDLLSIENENISLYHENIVCGLDIQRDPEDKTIIVKILFSGNSIHSSAMALNLVSNAVLKMHSSPGTQPSHILTVNEPIRKDKTSVTNTDIDMFLLTVPFGNIIFVTFKNATINNKFFIFSCIFLYTFLHLFTVWGRNYRIQKTAGYITTFVLVCIFYI